MLRSLIFITISLLFFVITGCNTSTPLVSPVNQSGPDTMQIQQNSKQDWQIKWDKTVKDAKKEGKVVIYGAATGELRDILIKGFNDKFGIPVEYMAAKGPEIATRILAERKAGLYLPDVIIGASSPAVSTLKPAGVFDPMEPVLLLPEVTDTKLWWQNKLPWVDNDHYFLAFLAYATPKIVVNPDIVKTGDIKAYRDLLDPKWKGRMALHDPTIAGAGQSWVAVMAQYIMGVDYLKQLAAQEPFISRDHRLLAEWVVRGKYPIGLSIESEAIEQMRAAGSQLTYIDAAEGTYVTTGTGFLSRPRNAPHPNAGTVFINWILSKDGQITYASVSRLQSAREDLPTANIDPLSMRKPGVKYVNTSTEEFWIKGPDYINLGKDIFGYLIK